MQIFNIVEELEKERKKNKKLEEENEKLKRNQVNALNRIKDLISLSKCEAVEGHYTNDNHSKYWNLFKDFAEELKDKIKGVKTEEYVYIPKWREEELLNFEERIDKAVDYIEHLDNVFIDSKEQDNIVDILKGDNK